MSRIRFREKTEEEKQAAADEKVKRDGATRAPAAQPPIAVAPAQEDAPMPAPPAVAVDAPGFALEPEPVAPKARKTRKKQAD